MTDRSERPTRIRIDFTIEVPADAMPALRELACAADLTDVRNFVKYEPEQYLLGYLSDNGVPATVARVRR